MKSKLKLALVIAMAASSVALTGCGRTVIDPNEYLYIDVSGMDTVGTASYYFDSEQLVDDNLKAFGLKDGYSDMDYLEAIGRVEATLGGKLDKKDGLSNGDSVSFRWDSAKIDRIEEKYKVRIELSDKSITVEGLEEAARLDPFEGLRLEYTGISPNAKVSFDTTDCDQYVRDNVSFRASGDKYANGDNVVVSASFNERKAFENGIIFTESEKTYVCENAAYYPDAYDKVDLTDIDSFFIDEVTSALAGDNYYAGGLVHGRSMFTDVNSEDEYVIDSVNITPARRLFLYAKNPVDTRIVNEYVVIYEVEITARKTAESGYTHDDLEVGDYKTVTYYARNYTDNVFVDSEGNTNKITTNDTGYKLYYMSYYGANPGLLSFRDPVDLNTTVDSLCESWRTYNLAEYNVDIIG